MEIVNEMPLTKKCCKCKIEKPAEANFVKNINSKDLYHSTCKQCIKEYQQANRDKMKVYQKEYQAIYKVEKHDELLEYTKQWQRENRDKTREYQRKSLAKPEVKAKRVEYNKLWIKNNPDKVKAAREKALAKKLAQKNDQQ